MNRQIARLALLGLVLIASLIVGTTYWQTWASAGLADKQDNAIQVVAQLSVKRGKIRASNGQILATNRRKHVGGQTLYLRRYPQGGLYSAVVGYSTRATDYAGISQTLHTVFDAAVDCSLRMDIGQFKRGIFEGDSGLIYLVVFDEIRIAILCGPPAYMPSWYGVPA